MKGVRLFARFCGNFLQVAAGLLEVLNHNPKPETLLYKDWKLALGSSFPGLNQNPKP